MIDYYFGVRETNQNSSDAGIKSEPTVEEHYLTLISNRLLKYVAPYINNQPYAGAKTYIDYTIVRLGLKPLANVRPLRPELAMIVVNDVIAFKYPINIPKCRDADNRLRPIEHCGIGTPPLHIILKRDKLYALRGCVTSEIRTITAVYSEVVGYGFVVGQTTNPTEKKKRARTTAIFYKWK